MILKVLILIMSCILSGSNSDHSDGYAACKYNYVKSANGYLCSLLSNNADSSTEISGQHLSGRTDDDVDMLVSFHLTFTELTSNLCDKFPNLKRLKIMSSDIAKVYPNALNNCKNLNEFHLISSKITELPVDLFSENPELTRIEINNNNNLTTLPENIFESLYEVRLLWLYRNQLDFLPENIFKSLHNLEKLQLSSNKLSVLNPSWFEDLYGLHDLSLRHNGITDLPKNAFANLINLESIWLSGNNLTTIHSDSFGAMTKFTDLYLRENQIESIDSKIIDDNNLMVIDMTGNVCSQIIVDDMSKDEVMKELSNCTSNYHPR
ncbi:leucine-rich repeat-containing protein 15-like [Chironomus tepperi]|uniref:leucine-rich repeat-containing protein 15-like n=1 Tax=Chironomus tepperi TaxID=113505 RepID=UPI00391F2473